MKNEKYELFKNELKKVVRQLFLDFTKDHREGDICGFALYSDDSAMSISAAINTYKHFEENIKDEEGYDSYFRFSPNEWQYDSLTSKGLDDLNVFLQQGLFLTPKKQFIVHRNRVYDISVEVLEELKYENLFDEMKDDFVLVFSITDFSDITIELPYIKRLNKESIAQEFEKWKEEEAEEEDDDGEVDDYDFDDEVDDELDDE